MPGLDDLDGVLDDEGDDIEEDDEALVAPLDRILKTGVSDVPMGPGFVPQVPIESEPMEAFTPETALCLRGPCRFFMRRRMPADVGNARGTFDRPLMQTERYCHFLPTHVFDLTGEPPVKECSAWYPVDVEEDRLRESTRDRVRGEHPEWFAVKEKVPS